ncbi:GIY-YIG nuclease family protein [Dyella sp.]|uniref:GIY-YIG nuclease family protein n=1 Tax=Dyella sp. TaxID=1869338 RepID=UPI002ED48121
MDEPSYPSFASRGRAYVYVLPWRDEDVLKLGFSRDPFTRMRTLHRRFYEVFDLDRGLLIAVDKVAQARRIERGFIQAWPDARAPAPLVVRDAAGGHTEWYRGIGERVIERARQLAVEEGWELHEPLRPWLLARLNERADWLYDGTTRLLEGVEYERFHGHPRKPAAHALHTLLALCEGIGLTLDGRLPDAVLAWYRLGGADRMEAIS